ncbi:gamma-glutamyltranspeptidase [Basidiobolus meristosporus CBS 931.73]|uniref:Glutathione hydrolase n=1 Tax=Basidiobolus meristosporus CBS 931.73 TaxID=1314790 RepID=A0A1Y1Z881_9FUNG|nr:gamma-glutamyltranspeptidase [Basidiobolus meristosporus CBS 931.73]|eukprot:ORY06461.1 gamma-glutamyltranspeptidase [Basidiobolus meristosporus CBS 931.73]
MEPLLPVTNRQLGDTPKHERKSRKLLMLGLALIGLGGTLYSLGGFSAPQKSSQKAILIEAEHGAVAADDKTCSQIGVQILKDDGNAIDAAIAGALCIGVINSFSSAYLSLTIYGYSSGGFMVIRNGTGAEVIDFREEAPSGAHRDMFNENPLLAQVGGLAVGIPGELKGFELAHQRYGKLPWKRLFEPSIRLSRDGFRVTSELAKRIEIMKPYISKVASFRAVFAPTGEFAKEGDILKRETLANTLEAVAKQGAKAFYSGPIAESMVKEIQRTGGIATVEDFLSYQALIREPLVGDYRGHKVITAPPPASGAILLSVLNILEGYPLDRDGLTTLHAHQILESFKFGYAQRTELGDPTYVDISARVAEFVDKKYAAQVRQNLSDIRTFPISHYNPKFDVEESPGTTHLSVVDKNQLSVALTSTVNLYFGSQVLDLNTGVILNNEMDDFSIPGVSNAFNLPPSPNNFVAPKKRPLSSSVPTITEFNGDLELVLGASGGSRITTAVLQTLINALDFDMNLADAVEYPRLHHQLYPNLAYYEAQYPQDIQRGLSERHHNVTLMPFHAVVQAIRRLPEGKIHAVSDPRKQGVASGY